MLNSMPIEDIVTEALVKAGEVLHIIITKEINLEDFKIYIETSDSDDEAFEDFNSMQPERNKITKDEHFKIKDVYYTIMDNFNRSKGKSKWMIVEV